MLVVSTQARAVGQALVPAEERVQVQVQVLEQVQVQVQVQAVGLRAVHPAPELQSL